MMEQKRHILARLGILSSILLALVATPVEANSHRNLSSSRMQIESQTNTASPVTTRVSIASDGSQSNGISYDPSISSDGRYIAFVSGASNLVANDTNEYRDIFVHDRFSGETSRISVSSSGMQGNNHSENPSISADGRYVAFESPATNLVMGDTNSITDIFLHDRQTRQTTRISVASDGSQASGENGSYSPAISEDGRYITYHSWTHNLVSDDTGRIDVFVYDTQTGETTRASIASDGSQANGNSEYPSISADGRYIAFQSTASNLRPGLINYFVNNVYVHDRQTGDTILVSVTPEGTNTGSASGSASISGDGRYVAFDSADRLLNDYTGYRNVYIYDLQTEGMYRASVASDGSQVYAESSHPSISFNGQQVAFFSFANTLVSDDTNSVPDYFVHDRQTGETLRISVATDGTEADTEFQIAYKPSLSSDGRYTAFKSPATNLVVGDTNTTTDIFIRDLGGSSTPDIGFRPNPHGYSFPNYGGSYPLPPALGDFTMDDMRRLYGDACVCRMVDGRCEIDYPVRLRLLMLNLKMNSGHCAGMALTSLRFFNGIDNPGDFQTGASATFDLEKTDVRRHIAYNQVKQYSDSVSVYRDQILNNPPSTILDYLQSYLSASPSEPVILEVWKTYLNQGHAITPYAIEPLSENVYAVKVYDSNHEDDENRFVTIDTINETWSYDLGSPLGTWEGDANTHTLAVLPLWLYAEPVPCPGSTPERIGVNDISNGEVWLAGDGHLLISDSLGRKIGFEGDQYHQEIPGAIGMPSPGGLGIDSEPVYMLPLTDSFTILLDGQSLSQAEEVSVTQFGPGYAAWVENVALLPETQDLLTVSSDGRSISYLSEDEKALTLSLALSDPEASHQFQVRGADLGAGATVSLSADAASGQLGINHALAGAGDYTLAIDRRDANGEQNFLHTSIPISATDTHYVNYADWDGSGALTLQIDQGSDGSMDSSVELTNMSHRIFLPINIKKD